jgi:hypothetical protein
MRTRQDTRVLRGDDPMDGQRAGRVEGYVCVCFVVCGRWAVASPRGGQALDPLRAWPLRAFLPRPVEQCVVGAASLAPGHYCFYLFSPFPRNAASKPHPGGHTQERRAKRGRSLYVRGLDSRRTNIGKGFAVGLDCPTSVCLNGLAPRPQALPTASASYASCCSGSLPLCVYIPAVALVLWV